MQITSVQLENFRNYRRLDICVGPSINVFFGENAQGKTNLIEAIYLCACARSHRTSRDREMIFHGEDGYKVTLSIRSDARKNTSEHSNEYEETVFLQYIDAVQTPEGFRKPRRVVGQDGVPFERISDFIGIFHAVIFAPEDLLLIKEGPSVRRRYLDLLISQVRPTYFFDLQTYAKILMQRNRTLKMLRQQKGLHELSKLERSEIEIWDYPLAQVGARLIKERLYFTQKVQQFAGEKHEQISGGKEKLFVRYRTIAGLAIEDEANPIREIEETLLKRWKTSHQEDYEKGNTSYGPHRDDLELSLDGDGLRSFASQGQQRSAALAMKLAELIILREETGESPVLLLDDVFSELDSSRRSCLLQNIGDAQVFISCTDRTFIEKELFDSCESDPVCDVNRRTISFFEVSDGSVEAR